MNTIDDSINEFLGAGVCYKSGSLFFFFFFFSFFFFSPPSDRAVCCVFFFAACICACPPVLPAKRASASAMADRHVPAVWPSIASASSSPPKSAAVPPHPQTESPKQRLLSLLQPQARPTSWSTSKSRRNSCWPSFWPLITR